MKKIFSLILMLALLTSMSAFGEAEITIQDIYDASNLETLLENHESVYVRYVANGDLYEEKYLSKDCSYIRYAGGEYTGFSDDFGIFTTDHSIYAVGGDSYTRSFVLDQDGLIDDYSAFLGVDEVYVEDGLRAEIQSVTENDGRITLISTLTEEAPESTGMEGMVSYHNEYVVDADTFEPVSSTFVLEYDNGMVYNVDVSFIYDGETPESMKVFVDYEQQTENLRTITIVSNPGAENEVTESVQVPKGLEMYLEPYFDPNTEFTSSTSEEDLYAMGTFTMYSDAACTEPFAFTEGDESDITIYVKWDK